MLATLLTILKIIGYILLGILGLLLLILLIALFVPVRYKAKGSYEDKVFYAKAEVSYLLHILSVKAIYDKKFDFKIAVFGISLGKKKNKPKKEKRKINNKSKEEQSKAAEKENTVVQNSLDALNIDSDFEVDMKEEKDSSVKTEKQTIQEKAAEDDAKDKDSKEAEEKEDKIKKAGEFLEKYKEIRELLEKKSTQEAFELCKDRIGRLLKCILPRRGSINIYIGLENAGVTGKIMGAYYALYAYIGKVVHITPYYDEQIIKGDFNLKGHIRLAPILYHLARIYFDKNCNKLIKKFLKKDKAKKAGKEKHE